MPTLFVTGGAGYVGSHCCKAFAQAGWRIVVYDNLSRGFRDLVKWGELIEGDITDPAALSAALIRVKPDAVAHFAAYASVGESMRAPDIYYRINVAGLINLLDAMRAADVSQLLFSSSCATYGVQDQVITEATLQSPINPYGETKLIGERVIRDYGAAYGLRSVILRYFNAAGCDPDLETGERNRHDPRIIPLVIKGALKGDFTLTINGSDFGTRDGTAIRDYVHVNDLADAHVRALQWLADGKPSDIFNLGTGSGASILELAAAAENVLGRKVQRQFGPRRPGDPPSLTASAEKAQTMLGWTPRFSDMDTIIRTAAAWIEKEPGAV